MTSQQRYQRSPKGLAGALRRQLAYRAADVEGFRAKDRAWYAVNTLRVYVKNLRMRYRISLVQWLALFHAQGQCCAICKATVPGSKRWATDHDHETGVVRGILCHRCNLCLGWLGDTGAVVQMRLGRMQSYLGIAE